MLATQVELTDEQGSAVDRLVRLSKPIQSLGGYAGCLSGSTKIIYNRGSRLNVREISLHDMYLKFNGYAGSGRGAAQRWDPDLTTYLSSLFPDGTVSRNEVVAVFKSGEKDVIRVSFDDGRFLVLTEDHPVAIGDDEYMSAGGLKVGSIVIGRGTLLAKGGKGKRPPSERPDRIVINTRFYPNGNVKIVECNGVFYRYKRVHRARLVYEAHMNDVPYEEFVDALKNDEVLSSSFVYLDRNIDVHHVDENPLNDVIENLEILGHAEHARHHDPERHFNKDYIREVKVAAVASAGREMTYDIQMQSPANNFCANGVFVHNTGKTTVIRSLVERLPDFAICAYTGKATQVLRRKGIQASTIHSLIYRPIPLEDGGVEFQLRDGSEFGYSGVIVDEASMVGRDVYDDLRSLDVPLIFVGDHGQLEPVGGGGFNLMERPDITLEKIHRNAGEIALFAEHLRRGREAGDWESRGQVHVITAQDLQDSGSVGEADQIIVAYNRTRCEINAMARENLGRPEDRPAVGDRVICLQNDRRIGVFNGMQGVVAEIDCDRRLMTFRSAEQDYRLRYVPEAFGAERTPERRSGLVPFDYAYCITCHKAQGDEYDHVLVIEQKCSRWSHERWAYTAASRAKSRLTWII